MTDHTPGPEAPEADPFVGLDELARRIEPPSFIRREATGHPPEPAPTPAPRRSIFAPKPRPMAPPVATIPIPEPAPLRGNEPIPPDAALIAARVKASIDELHHYVSDQISAVEAELAGVRKIIDLKREVHSQHTDEFAALAADALAIVAAGRRITARLVQIVVDTVPTPAAAGPHANDLRALVAGLGANGARAEAPAPEPSHDP
jgi:hypothetical protein